MGGAHGKRVERRATEMGGAIGRGRSQMVLEVYER